MDEDEVSLGHADSLRELADLAVAVAARDDIEVPYELLLLSNKELLKYNKQSRAPHPTPAAVDHQTSRLPWVLRNTHNSRAIPEAAWKNQR
jgi:hypothetical protein